MKEARELLDLVVIQPAAPAQHVRDDALSGEDRADQGFLGKVVCLEQRPNLFGHRDGNTRLVRLVPRGDQIAEQRHKLPLGIGEVLTSRELVEHGSKTLGVSLCHDRMGLIGGEEIGVG